MPLCGSTGSSRRSCTRLIDTIPTRTGCESCGIRNGVIFRSLHAHAPVGVAVEQRVALLKPLRQLRGALLAL